LSKIRVIIAQKRLSLFIRVGAVAMNFL